MKAKARPKSIALLMASSICAHATVSIQWEFEALRDAAGNPLAVSTAYVLVADTGGNGMVPDSEGVVGVSLAVGSSVGQGTVFFAGTTAGAVAQGSVVSLDMDAFGVQAGDSWSLLWFPGINSVGDSVVVDAGQSFGSFQSSTIDPVAIGFGADQAMVFPADGSPLVTTLYFDSSTEATISPTPGEFTASLTAVPEPSSFALTATAMMCMLLRRRPCCL